jgi:cytochrome c-type biogenesis protein CcmH/NrfG
VTQRREDLALRQALGRLPAEQASEHFTQRVLDGLENRQATKVGMSSTRVVGVVVALATVGLALGLWIRAQSPTDPPAQQKSTQQLRLEYESLQEEVESLRSLAAQPPPVLYLGGDSRIDLVLDLGQVDPRATQPDIRPAAIGPEGRRNP